MTPDRITYKIHHWSIHNRKSCDTRVLSIVSNLHLNNTVDSVHTHSIKSKVVMRAVTSVLHQQDRVEWSTEVWNDVGKPMGINLERTGSTNMVFIVKIL